MNSQKEEFSNISGTDKEVLQSRDNESHYSNDQTLSGEHGGVDNNISSGKECNIGLAREKLSDTVYDLSEYCDTTDENNAQRDTNKHSNILEEGLYDGDIAEIYLGEGIGSVEKIKSSEGSDSNLSEMTNSFGPMEDSEVDLKANSLSPNKNQELLPSGSDSAQSSVAQIDVAKLKIINQTGCPNETRKRPLSPNDFPENTLDSKRVKSEPVTYFDHSLDSDANKGNNNDGVIDLCPPVAIVAPLGFCEDIFIDDVASVKNTKDETNCVKNDISSILDSLDQDDDKNLSMFDSVFEKMKTDIIEGQSFKTLDDGKWTFDGKPSNVIENFSKVTKVYKNEDRCENQNVTKTDKDLSKKTEFKRANSVEHDIEDFEKVLNSVIANASRFPKGNEGVMHKFSTSLPVPGIQSSIHSKQCKQPCSHVSNSDLLRELLDQKSDTHDTQTKTRQEIDLSFLHSDLISGKGLSVSSDKILQTRTIDPRLTSIPHVEQVLNIGQAKLGHDIRENNQISNHKSNAIKLLEGDHISLAEQRRASVTLHHKVPSHEQQTHQSNMFNEGSGDASSIIKEAFDFATEISDLTNDESDSVSSQPANSVPFDARQQMLTIGALHSSPQNENYLNRNSYNKNLKIDPMQNQQMLRNSRMQEMHSGNGLLTFANPNGIPTSDPNLPPQLAGPFMNSPENPNARSHDIRQQHDPNQRAALLSRKVENMSPHGNRLLSANSEMQSLKGSFEHMQNPNMMHTNPMKQLHMGPMDPSRNTNMAQRQTPPYMGHNISAGYPTTVAARANQLPRSNISDLGLHSQEKMHSYRYEPGLPMNQMSRAMIPPENNYSMGMQERIRAMNVQQWYRRRMQAQMNRQVNPQTQMMRQPMPQTQGMGSHMIPHSHGMGLHPNTQGQGLRMRQRHLYQGTGSGSQMMLPEQGVDPQLRAMQTQVGHNTHMNNSNTTDNQRIQPHVFSQGQGQDQMNFETQNLRHMQYGQQVNQQNKVAESEAVNPMYIPRPFSAEGMVDNTNSNTAPLRELSQQFDVKRDTFNSQPVQDMFPFNI
ncbi:uncharacterized protein LOC123561461 [Mercenaria mercenaria]|uniref:uncharacterized protein LOC123561461 n=1 Tax=Mercenaria mercenaria TaxID=6596 RepID=UPI00234FB4E0|nr:uncharacterized protein LOC123561461 [Mercenaria mercenaria]XP_045209775.2 uncharacterized protein LOC123561461 [Mercenaria mercenaria]